MSPIVGRRRRRDGQVLVEFALVFPLFLLLLMSIVEFAFLFNAILSVNNAARSATLTAAEAGSSVGADCIILNGVEQDVAAPADRARIQQVLVYRTTLNGTPYPGSSATIYTRSTASSISCVFPDRPTIVVPYTRTANGYPEIDRCNFLKGCPVDSHGLSHTPSVDHVGVRIVYSHVFKTPIRTIFGSGSLDFDRANSMRMEPVL